MTQFLASVTGTAEALVALEGGADIIDLKDPRRGALGAVSPAVLEDVLRAVAGRRPVSAVAGDVPMEAGAVAAAVRERLAAAFVKIGLFPAPRERRAEVIAALGAFASRTRLVAVFFADGDPDFTLLPLLAEAGFAGAMLDTMGKGSGRLLAHLPMPDLEAFVAACRARALLCGLAGSLEAPDVPRLRALAPDFLGFRGALTAGPRDAPVDGAAVAAIARLVHAAPPAGTKGGDERPGGNGEAAGTDRIFVRDLVVEMEVGAYGFERGRPQRVRFSVEADVRRFPARPERMQDIYSYDLITDAVARLARRGHTDLVETLAEDLAASILADARVRTVAVRVEKLDLGPAAVGVEIRRSRERTKTG